MAHESDSSGIGRPAARAKQTVRQSVRSIPLGAAISDLPREASEILDQNDSERDRRRPEFANG